jgi:ribosomal-protein-alanine N-acetyltransferase
MISINFDPFPILTTERLVLRRPQWSEVDEMFKYRSDKELMRHIPHRYATSIDQVEEMMHRINRLIDSNEGINWAITLKGDDTPIGMVGYVHFNKDHYRGEIGYILHTPYHGTGIIMEAFNAAIDHGFNEFGLHSIEAVVNSENIASKRLLEKRGFSNDAFFRDYLYLDGRFVNANVYSLLASDAKQ